MGLPKAMLPFGDEVMLQRVARILGEVVDRVVVVAAKKSALAPPWRSGRGDQRPP